MPSALITGGAGFIGSHLADACLDAGWSVAVLDDFSSGKRENVPLQAELIEASIRSSAAAAAIREGGFDTVIHCAAQMDVRKSVADPIFDAEANIIGLLNLLEAIRSLRKRPRFVFTSTGGVLYGDFTTPPNVETFAKDPESPYAISKLAGEYYLAYYGRVHGLETVSLRLGNVYGPRQDAHGEAGVVAIFCGRILSGRPLTIFGTGEQTRDYIYVSDVARAVQLAATRELPPIGKLDARAFNIGTGRGVSVNELAKRLERAAGSNVPVEFAPARSGEQLKSFVSIDKAASELGWQPNVSLDDGLALTYQWFATTAATVSPQGATTLPT
jgi:UDP-glucose 4-epimerase